MPGQLRTNAPIRPRLREQIREKADKHPAMTVALVDRLTHHCSLLKMNGDSYRFKEGLRHQQEQ
jgi:DNA replication protein DnaC